MKKTANSNTSNEFRPDAKTAALVVSHPRPLKSIRRRAPKGSSAPTPAKRKGGLIALLEVCPVKGFIAPLDFGSTASVGVDL